DVVHAVDNRRHFDAAARPAEDDVFRAGVDVLVRVGILGEDAGALEHQLDVHVVPRELRRVALAQVGNRLPVDHQLAVAGFDLPAIRPVDRVVLQQIGDVLQFGNVIHGDQLKAGRVQQNLEG